MSLHDLRRLPGVTLLEHEPLAPRTTWKIGGPARWLVEIAAREALVPALALLRATHTRWAVLGNGSNVLVSDAGFAGAVLTLTGSLAEVGVTRDVRPGIHRVVAGGGLSLTRLLRLAKDESLAGLWVLGGVPGTVGGAVRMNAGTRWGEVADTLVAAELATAEGLTAVDAAALRLSYRHAELPMGAVVVSATFEVTSADGAMRDKLDEVLTYRKASQPLQLPSCGSVFANPPGDAAGRLIEAVGLKGHRIGALEVSTQHANWIVNLGGGTAADASSLIRLCQRRVKETFGVELRPEVQRFGDWPEEVAP
jgi:UDP-N-acetylmuramate dehydrogenase